MGREDVVDGGGQVGAPHALGLAQHDRLLPQLDLHCMGMNRVADGSDHTLGGNENDRPFVRYCGSRLQLENEPYEHEEGGGGQ